MLIDISSIDHDAIQRRQKENRIRIALNKMTVRQLREFARERHISLAGASSKRGLVSEIMGQYGHQWKLEEGERIG